MIVCSTNTVKKIKVYCLYCEFICDSSKTCGTINFLSPVHQHLAVLMINSLMCTHLESGTLINSPASVKRKVWTQALILH